MVKLLLARVTSQFEPNAWACCRVCGGVCKEIYCFEFRNTLPAAAWGRACGQLSPGGGSRGHFEIFLLLPVLLYEGLCRRMWTQMRFLRRSLLRFR